MASRDNNSADSPLNASQDWEVAGVRRRPSDSDGSTTGVYRVHDPSVPLDDVDYVRASRTSVPPAPISSTTEEQRANNLRELAARHDEAARSEATRRLAARTTARMTARSRHLLELSEPFAEDIPTDEGADDGLWTPPSERSPLSVKARRWLLGADFSEDHVPPPYPEDEEDLEAEEEPIEIGPDDELVDMQEVVSRPPQLATGSLIVPDDQGAVAVIPPPPSLPRFELDAEREPDLHPSPLSARKDLGSLKPVALSPDDEQPPSVFVERRRGGWSRAGYFSVLGALSAAAVALGAWIALDALTGRNAIDQRAGMSLFMSPNVDPAQMVTGAAQPQELELPAIVIHGDPDEVSADESPVAFDGTLAEEALQDAAVVAAECNDPASSATQLGVVYVTFASNGRATDARLEAPSTLAEETRQCILSAFQTLRVEPFTGGPVTVKRALAVR